MKNTKGFFQAAGKIARTIVLRWSIIAVFTVFLMWYLQYRVSSNSAEAAWRFWDEKPVTFWYSALILFCIVSLIYGIIHHLFCSLGVSFAIVTIITYINNTKVDFRSTPLLPEDFQLADQTGSLTKFIDVGVLTRVVLAVVLSITLGILLDYLTKKYLSFSKEKIKIPKKVDNEKDRIEKRKYIIKKTIAGILPRAVIIPASIIGLGMSTDFLLNHGIITNQEIEWLDHTSFIGWNQTLNYQENGFLLAFIYNVNKATLEKPDDYNEEKISTIKKKYQEEADKNTNKDRKNYEENDYNIVYILGESFYDTSLIWNEYPFSGSDPLPNFHSIMKKYPAGYMFSIDYGGGTANIEFEADTGLTNYWAKTVPYTDIIPRIDNITSMAKDAKKAGYNTTAIHSFSGGMYKRNYTLKIEGFDRFITDADMRYQEHDGNSEYINDRSIYNETIDVLKESQEKQLISVITMQNHAPYVKSNYNEEDYKFDLKDFDEEDAEYKEAITTYLQTAYNSDKYLGEFLENLKKLDEKTVVLFFGDHAPGLYNNAHLYQGNEITNLTQLTPYFIWSNFTMDDHYSDKKFGKEFYEKFGKVRNSSSEDTSTEKNKNIMSIKELSNYITLPTTTPNCLSNTLYNVLNIKLNATGELLRQVCKDEPILSYYYLGNDAPTGKAVKDYELVNYDILGGDQFWFK